MKNNFAVWVALSLLVLVPLNGAELQRGKIKIVLNEKNGRFVLTYTDDIANPVPVSLFSSEDPTTSKVRVQWGDKTLTIGDDSQFTPVYEATPTGGKLTWTSKTLRVTENFEFLTSLSSSVADGIKETLTFTNLSETQTTKLAVRLVFDTSLGEKKDHFKTSTSETINTESRLETPLPDWWLSPSSTDEKAGLLFMLGKGATVPSRVLFANWQRLDNSSWDFALKQGRDFNFLPYSYNDSAVAHYYDGQDLAPGASREIVLMYGSRTAITFANAKVGSANVLSDLLQESQNKAGSGTSAVAQDLQSLEDVFLQINEKLKDPAKATPDDLKLFKAILDQLESRKAALIVATPPKTP